VGERKGRLYRIFEFKLTSTGQEPEEEIDSNRMEETGKMARIPQKSG